MKDEIIDYTKEKQMYFWKLEALEVKMQHREKDRKLKNVRVRLLCPNCNKPFIRWLHDYRLAFGFACSDKCLKKMEAKARVD